MINHVNLTESEAIRPAVMNISQIHLVSALELITNYNIIHIQNENTKQPSWFGVRVICLLNRETFHLFDH